VFVILSLTKGF